MEWVKATSAGMCGFILLCLLLYFLSFGIVLTCFVDQSTSQANVEAILEFYRPLFRYTPAMVMRGYAQMCGLSDIEAFFLVEAQRQ